MLIVWTILSKVKFPVGGVGWGGVEWGGFWPNILSIQVLIGIRIQTWLWHSGQTSIIYFPEIYFEAKMMEHMVYFMILWFILRLKWWNLSQISFIALAIRFLFASVKVLVSIQFGRHPKMCIINYSGIGNFNLRLSWSMHRKQIILEKNVPSIASWILARF